MTPAASMTIREYVTRELAVAGFRRTEVEPGYLGFTVRAFVRAADAAAIGVAAEGDEAPPRLGFEIDLATGLPPREHILTETGSAEREWLRSFAERVDGRFVGLMARLSIEAAAISRAMSPSSVLPPDGVLLDYTGHGYRSTVTLVPDALCPYGVALDDATAHAQVRALVRGDAVRVAMEARVLRGEGSGGEVLGRARLAGLQDGPDLGIARMMADALLQGAAAEAAVIVRKEASEQKA